MQATMNNTIWGLIDKKASLKKRTWGSWWTKLNISQRSALEAKKATGIPSCSRRSAPSR